MEDRKGESCRRLSWPSQWILILGVGLLAYGFTTLQGGSGRGDSWDLSWPTHGRVAFIVGAMVAVAALTSRKEDFSDVARGAVHIAKASPRESSIVNVSTLGALTLVTVALMLIFIFRWRQDEVRATGFVVVDSSGETRARLGLLADTYPVLELRGLNDKAELRLAVDGFPKISLVDPAGNTTVYIDGLMPGVSLGYDGVATAHLVAGGNYPALVLADRDGETTGIGQELAQKWTANAK